MDYAAVVFNNIRIQMPVVFHTSYILYTNVINGRKIRQESKPSQTRRVKSKSEPQPVSLQLKKLTGIARITFFVFTAHYA